MKLKNSNRNRNRNIHTSSYTIKNIQMKRKIVLNINQFSLLAGNIKFSVKTVWYEVENKVNLTIDKCTFNNIIYEYIYLLSKSTSRIISRISLSEGLRPKDLMRLPSSCELIAPSLFVSNMPNASLISVQKKIIYYHTKSLYIIMFCLKFK